MKKILFTGAFLSLVALMASAVNPLDTTHSLSGDSIQSATDRVGESLPDVVVTGTRNAVDMRHLPMTVTVIERQQLTSQHQPSVLPTVMQQVPGLMVTSRSMMGYGVSTGSAGGINMRGISSGGGQLLVLIDGHPQYNGIYGHPISDSYQTLMAERVEVLRGPASVLYGSNAMGGVMNIVTRSSQKSDTIATNIRLGAGSYGTFQAEASNQLRRGKFSSTVSAQYGRTDNHRPRLGFEQYGGYLKLGYDFTPHWNAYADADIVHFNSSHPGATSSPLFHADQHITRGVVSAALENHYDRTSGALSMYYNFGRHKIDDGVPKPDSVNTQLFQSKDMLAGFSLFQSLQLFDGNRLTVGLDYQHIFGHAYYTSTADSHVITTGRVASMKQSGKSHRNEIAGYVDFRQDITAWLTMDAGLRLDHHSIAGTEWIPQAGIVVRPLSTGEVKAMVSKGFRNPTMRETYLYPSSSELLEPERLWNYELSWRHRSGPLHYAVNLYYIKGDNMIETINRKNVNTGKIENYGVELEAAWRLTPHWTISTNHSLLHMEHPVIAAPTYKGYLGAHYHQRRWTVDAGLQCISGLYTSVDEPQTKENFCLLNASVGYALLRRLSLWLRGENLLAQSYEINLGYPMPRATFMSGVDWNF